VIFQLIDDHSRYAVASLAAWAETADAAIAVIDKAIAEHGALQRLLSDNGTALNPSRRGVLGQLVAHLTRLGVQAITGKPHKPTTQGKNERFHQTLFRYLDKQPLAASLEQLQSQVDAFDAIYNTERPHQGLPGRVTPLTAWLATPKADPPHPTTRPATRYPTTRADTHQTTTQERRHHPPRRHLHGRPTPIRATRPHHRRPPHNPDHRPRRHHPHRAHPTRTRHHLRQQRPTPRTTPPNVTDVLTHELSPMS